MDKKSAVIKVKKYLKVISGILKYEKAFLFGSYAKRRYSKESDIDVGIFVDKIDGDYFETLKKLYRLRRNIEPRIEPHLFINGSDISGFAEIVKAEGIPL